jgi:hypothetical protein
VDYSELEKENRAHLELSQQERPDWAKVKLSVFDWEQANWLELVWALSQADWLEQDSLGQAIGWAELVLSHLIPARRVYYGNRWPNSVDQDGDANRSG